MWFLFLLLGAAAAFDDNLATDTPQMILDQNLPVEIYDVHTTDGYILTVHRIPNLEAKKSALLVHGLGTNSGCWVTNLRNNTLAFMLYDAGYDVWIANCRGSRYSLKHETLTKDDDAFWEFSFTEYGLKDVPAIMDFMTATNGLNEMALVGHSEGTANLFVLLSMLPDYAARVPVYLSLAPAVYVSNTKQDAFLLMDHLKIANIMADLGISHVGLGTFGQILPYEVCKHLETLCDYTMQEACGWDLSSLNKERAGLYTAQMDGSSTRNLLHGFQCVDSGEFKMFDFGEDKNMEKYGQKTPPRFPIEDITTPIVMYYGGVDKLVDQYDVEKYLIPALRGQTWSTAPNFIPKFNHLDFIWAWDATEYQRMVREIDSFMEGYPSSE